MASTYFQNPSSGASSTTERRTLTISFWVKRSKLSSTQYMISGYNNASYYNGIIFNSGDHLRVFEMAGATTNYSIKTTRRFRDTNAWSHIVVAFDTTQATASDRIKIYVNGVQETAFDTTTYPSQNHNTYFGMTSGGDGYPTYIGGNPGGTYFDGLMADVYLVGGTALTPSSFGETDSDTGEWKPDTNPTITYGSTAGVNSHLTFENASNLGEDTSGNNNDFTVATGTVIQTQDCPSNNFATFNPYVSYQSGTYPTFSNGNTSIRANGNGNYGEAVSTLGMPKSGKFYAEFKRFQNDATFAVGVGDMPKIIEALRTNTQIFNTSFSGNCSVRIDGSIMRTGQEFSSFFSSGIANGDIIGIAIDLDNGAFYAHKNGTYGAVSGVTGVPTSGSSKTGAVDLSGDSWWTSAEDICFHFGSTSGGGWDGCDANFGNGYFASTAISSEGTNASGIGKFEYDVPTGYTALSTKGLNQ